ncbi:hypothetical protein BD413DRAFT_88745 [Trametes elegans]|nr:hypothetical protein BD413DRAFT_88745 [Trametes elegans]
MAAPPPYSGAPGAPPAGPALGDTFGVMLLSTIITSALYGVTVLQSLYYYDKFPKDPWIMKATVAVIWILDTVTIVLDSHAVYYYLIVNFNNPAALMIQVWSAQVEILITYSAVLLAQLFYIHRIFQLRPHIWQIPAVMGLIALASYLLIIVIVVQVFRSSAWSDVGSTQVDRPLVANWVTGMIVDFAITIVLCWYLWQERRVVRPRTHRLLNRIIIFSVQRGAIAAVVQVMTLLTVSAHPSSSRLIHSHPPGPLQKFILPQNLVWLAFHNVLSKVYANSMLATLNSRIALRGMMMDVDGTELTLPTTARASMVPGGPAPGDRKPERESALRTLQFASQPSTVLSTSTLEPRSFSSAEDEEEMMKFARRDVSGVIHDLRTPSLKH